MSYNYEADPWAEPSPGGAQQNPGAQNTSSYGAYTPSSYAYSAGTDPYSDNYAGAGVTQQPSQSGNYYGQQDQYDDQQQDQDGAQQPSEQQQQSSTYQSEPSWCTSFLRAHVPLCAPALDLCSKICQPATDFLFRFVNRDLLVTKIFYFFFYSAFGSLFPLMGVYFKQLGMNPGQVGILTGVRPFIEMISAPFWNSLADRFQKGKALLLFSLLCSIVFTQSLAHIRTATSKCIAYNDTHYVLYTPYNETANEVVRRLLWPHSALAGQPNAKGNDAVKLTEVEVKKEILAMEENQNDQRRRRRKRSVFSTSSSRCTNAGRTIERPQKLKARLKDIYTYQVQDDVGLYGESRLDIDLDFENDFQDSLVDDEHSPGQSIGSGRERVLFDGDTEVDVNDGHKTNQIDTFVRNKRSLRGGSKKDDDLSVDDETLESESREEEDEKREHEPKEMKSEEELDETGGDGASSNEELKHREKTSRPNRANEETTDIKHSNNMPSVKLEGKVNETAKSLLVFDLTRLPPRMTGKSPMSIGSISNNHDEYVSPTYSAIVYKVEDIKEVFILLLLLISLGEFFSAPAITIVDGVTLNYLGENTDLYGRQRMFGSLGWSITLFFVGMTLDDATQISHHPCMVHERERNYKVCFNIFSTFMFCALVTATQFRMMYTKTSGASNSQTIVTTTADNKTVTTTVEGADIDDIYASTQPRNIFNTAPPVNAPPPSAQTKEKFEFIDKWKSAVFAQRTWTLPEWFNVFRQFKNSLHLMYLFITWFLGCGVGLVFTFLFWHLQDIGGTPTLFGICSVINHISEVLAYFFSSFFIKRYGHSKVLGVGLGCNVIRFFYVAVLSNAYYALPFELVQGITHGACFAACCSYISHVSKPELKASTQGVMQGLHHGFGRACGALLGGFMINAIGSRWSFCIYGLLSGCVLAGFVYVRKKFSSCDDEVKIEDQSCIILDQYNKIG